MYWIHRFPTSVPASFHLKGDPEIFFFFLGSFPGLWQALPLTCAHILSDIKMSGLLLFHNPGIVLHSFKVWAVV